MVDLILQLSSLSDEDLWLQNNKNKPYRYFLKKYILLVWRSLLLKVYKKEPPFRIQYQ